MRNIEKTKIVKYDTVSVTRYCNTFFSGDTQLCNGFLKKE